MSTSFDESCDDCSIQLITNKISNKKIRYDIIINNPVIEMKNNKDNSIFCGTLHYESKELDDTHLSHYPKDVQEKYMQEYVQQFDNKKIICVCNRCLKGILLGKGKGIHLLELLFNK